MKLHVSDFMKNLENKLLLLNDWRKRFRETSPTQISEEKKQEVLTAMGDGTCSSQRGASNAFGISVSSVNRIVKSSSRKRQIDQRDYGFVIWFCQINWKILDEVSLSLNGTVNSRNCYYYAERNEHRIIKKTLRSVSITVWACLLYTSPSPRD